MSQPVVPTSLSATEKATTVTIPPTEPNSTDIPEGLLTDSVTLSGKEEDLESGEKGEKEEEDMIAASNVPVIDEFLVTLKGREHLNPHTWGENYRWGLTLFGGLLVLNASFASSAPSNLIPSIIEHFGVSEEVGILLISIFVAGYIVG